MDDARLHGGVTAGVENFTCLDVDDCGHNQVKGAAIEARAVKAEGLDVDIQPGLKRPYTGVYLMLSIDQYRIASIHKRPQAEMALCVLGWGLAMLT